MFGARMTFRFGVHVTRMRGLPYMLKMLKSVKDAMLKSGLKDYYT